MTSRWPRLAFLPVLILVLDAHAVRGMSLREIQERAQDGDVHQQAHLAHLYFRGEQTPRNLAAASRWATRAATEKQPVAMVILGLLQQEDGGPEAASPTAVAQLFATAFPLLQEAAQAKDPLAAAYLGLAYLKGLGTASNPAEAARWYERAADADVTMAISELAFLHTMGLGVKRDPERGVKLYRKAAENGDPEAAYMLGGMTETGHGLDVDRDRAMAWYRRAAESGHTGAEFRLAELLDEDADNPQALRQAAEWYRRAAEQGHGQAQEQWAWRLYNGTGVKQDLPEAAVWFRRAAEQGSVSAQSILATMLHEGIGIEKDDAQAAQWAKAASEAGDATAQVLMSQLCFHGQGVRRDVKQAAEWCRRAAEQGHVEARYNLGTLYDTGEGVPRDLKAAAYWYGLAAAAGQATAQFNLATLYDKGEGVAKDPVQAAVWYGLAAENGLLPASERHARLAAALSEAQRQQAAELREAILEQAATPPEKAGPATPGPFTAYRRTGTGWLSPEGLVVTAYSVVQRADRLTVAFAPGRRYRANVVLADRANNIAILAVAGDHLPPGLPLAETDAVTAAGDWVTTGGFSAPRLWVLGPRFAAGEVLAASGPEQDPRLYRLSLPVEGGSDGGPVLNQYGEVVGLLLGAGAATAAFHWNTPPPAEAVYALRVGYVRLLLAMAEKPRSEERLPRAVGDLETLKKRLADSIALVVAE